MIRSEWALRVWLILFVIGIFIVSCSSGIRDQPTNVLKSSISPTVQSEISPTRQPKTATPSELATGITTATNSLSTPTPAPVVTLSLDIAQDKASILTTSADCQLPCWNQLTPGLSAEEDLQGFYAHFGTDIRNIDRIPNKDHSVTYYGGSEPNVFDSPWPIQVTVKMGKWNISKFIGGRYHHSCRLH